VWLLWVRFNALFPVKSGHLLYSHRENMFPHTHARTPLAVAKNHLWKR
jgi:hypothetical protein